MGACIGWVCTLLMFMHYVAVGLLDRGMLGEPFVYGSEVLVAPGVPVEVPFGKEHVRAVCLGPWEGAVPSSVKSIVRVLSSSLLDGAPLLAPWQCALIQEMASFYIAPFHKVLRQFLPEHIAFDSFTPRREVYVQLKADHPEVGSRAKKLQELLAFLREGEVLEARLKDRFSDSLLRKARQEGYVERREGALLSVRGVQEQKRERFALTQEQGMLLDVLRKASGKTTVLHAVTGAGKSEVYLRLAEDMTKQGKGTILLVPEIALTGQLVSYVARTFGERVAVFHSHLTPHEKMQEWMRVRTGGVDVVVGSRSAIFAPMQNLGLVILDEEHEWTYKNDQHPRYTAHTVTEMMHKVLPGLHVVMGSATPRVESMWKASEGAWGYVGLQKKIYEQHSC